MLCFQILTAQNTREFIQNERQIFATASMLERDTEELTSFRTLAQEFQLTLDQGRYKKAEKLGKKLVAGMNREIEQTRQKLAFARREVGQSRTEQRTNIRENRRNRSRFSGQPDDVRDIARDRRNTRDDRRDTRDDILDAAELQNRYDNQQALYERLNMVSYSRITPDVKQDIKESIIRTFIRTMEADLDETREELREDLGERREDRRERRDDRRERREGF
jgi:hypothetical protein